MYGKTMTFNIVQKKSTNFSVCALNKWRRIPYVRENDDPKYIVHKKAPT